MIPDFETVLDILIGLCLEAGREIMAIYADPAFGVAVKSDASPVTQADTRAEAAILRGLRKNFPDIPVVAEEEAAAGRVPECREKFFLVDPLDGTKEFVGRNGEFTVNIALIENGVPVAGVVYAPAAEKLFAGAGDRAFEFAVDGGRVGAREPIFARTAPERLVAVGSRSHGTEATNAWLDRFAVERFESSGSSLKFCLVAAGRADLYPRLGRTMEWDTAAGDAILRAAGGIVTDLDGVPLRYNKRDQAEDADFANGSFVAYGDPALVALATAAHD